MQAQNHSIKEWAKDDRPREKLRCRGARELSDSELLAVLLRSGLRRRSAVDLAREVLQLVRHDLTRLSGMTVKELCRIRGIGETKAATIVAALELGRRRMLAATPTRKRVTSSREVAEYVRYLAGDLRQEVFGVIFLNRAGQVQHHEVISTGGLTSTVADPRVIFRKALAEDAISMILFHNHPSGNLRPSAADEALTERISAAARLFDIRLLDHLIVAEAGYFSFADEGLL